MKNLLLALLCATVFNSCSKPDAVIVGEYGHEKQPYRVVIVGKTDTTTSSTMFAREQTTGLVIAEDAKLKAVLVAYQKVNGHGVYTVEVTNKQAEPVIIRWGWDGLTIDSITPPDDVLQGTQTRVYTLTGDAKEGRIKLKAEGLRGGDNSSTLIISITLDILPIKIAYNTAKYDAETGKVTISFAVEEPALAEWYIIQKYVGGAWQQAALIASDGLTKQHTIKL